MFFIQRIVFQFFLGFLLQTSVLSAKPLDIFQTSKPFLPILPALDGKSFDLDSLQKEDIPEVLKFYEISEKKSRLKEEKNLFVLAIGHLNFKMGRLNKASQYLKSKITGNFILEDFRLNTLAFIYKERGLMELKDQHYLLAIESFKKSENLRLKIFKYYPDSPFHADVSRDLAEIEYLMGEGYFLALNYKAAWKTFRRSLMRDFPKNTDHKIKVTRALANNYQSAGDIESAADIYASLIKLNPSLAIQKEAFDFFNIYENSLKKLAPDIERLKLEPPKASNAKTKIKKPHAPQKKPGIIYKNRMVQEFYDSLSQDNLEKILGSGLRVLRNYPGIQEAKGVVRMLKQLLPLYLENHSTNERIKQIAALLPMNDLNDLAYSMWVSNETKKASYYYEKIIEYYPLDISACHKALFFLGRIAEDEGNYSIAVAHYEHLLNKYNFGPFTTITMFKIPWIERLEQKYDLARAHFERLIKFYSSPAYKELKAHFSATSYLTAGKYWLAQTYGAMGNKDKKDYWIKQLSRHHVFDFYTILTQIENSIDLKKFLIRKETQESAFRNFGLGEIARKRLSRAEQLIAIGFRKHGVKELANLTYQKDNPAFSFYITDLLKRGGGISKAINFSWKLSGYGKPDHFSRPIAEGLYPKGHMSPINDTLSRYNLDPLLVLSLIRQESAFNARVTSKANAVGLMQLIPPTAKEVAHTLGLGNPSTENLKNPDFNVRLGIEYLNSLLVSFNQNMVYALAAYNAGPTKIRQWVALRSDMTHLEFIESIPYSETRNYVKKILRNYAIYLSLYDEQNMNRFKEIFVLEE
jgi:soluble lytic murein transglycosylase-like protein/TolA-binding protein